MPWAMAPGCLINSLRWSTFWRRGGPVPASCRCWPALGWWLAQALWWGPTHCRWGASPPPYGSASCRLCARRQGYTSGLCRPGLLCPAERKRPCIAFGPGLAAVLLPTIPWSSAVLQEARDKFPALARWATWCYRQASNLQFGDTVLQSSSGVQQGDPLGPLLFAAAIQPLAAELRASAVDLSMFYLDDGVLAGSVEAVASALAHLQRAAADVGLALNLAKCEAITVGMTPAAALGPIAPSLLTASDGSSRVLTDFEFLGAGVGSPLHLETHAAARVDAASKLLHAIGELDDPQVALRLLRASAGYARLVHTMRCCPPAGHESALDRFNHLVQECFSSFTGLHLEAAAWAQATRRGLSQAGLGLRSTKAHAAGAYLASVGASATLCGELDPGYWLDRSGGVAAALSAFNDQLEAGQHLTIDAALRLSQKEFSQRASPKPAQTLGAPSATLSWTRMGTMVGCVLLAVSAPCVTMPCGTWFLHGPNEVAFDPSERKLASCYHSGRMT